jgi:hypothetical protein
MSKPKTPTITRTDLGYNKREPIKIATSNLFIETGEVPVDYMVGAIFNEIGGQEFLAYEPADLLIRPETFPISDVATNLTTYSSTNILSPVDGILSTIADYTISLNNYLRPPDYTVSYVKFINPNAYITDDYKYVVILLEDGAEEFDVEVQFLSGTV